MLDSKGLFVVAEKTANWMIANQIHDRLDANKGRSVYCYQPSSGHTALTNSWPTGGMSMGLLAMYRRTGDRLYLERAELAGRYIMSLQVVDSRQDRYYGVIRECTPQSLEFCPRDAATAAWSLLWLYKATDCAEYLDRAVLFADWLLKHGTYKGWPLWAMFMDGQAKDYYARGSFQSGVGLFYHDMFMVTGDVRYIEHGLEPIATTYRDEFLCDNGEIIQQRDIFTNQIATHKSGAVEGSMHHYNDDFGNSMLQAAADLLGDESYRRAAHKFAHWLADHQDEDGGFRHGSTDIHSAVPIALMYFNELGRHYHDARLLGARDTALQKLIAMQLAHTGDAKLEGGFCGVPDGKEDDRDGPCVHMRTTMYALIALLKLEGKVSEIWLGNSNRRFSDPLLAPEDASARLAW